MLYEWKEFLSGWSKEIIESKGFAEFLAVDGADYPGSYTDEVLESGWLGYPGATEEQINAAEARLGITLPPDYRAFLQVTNGWRYITRFIPRLWSTEEIDWLRFTDQSGVINAWAEPHILDTIKMLEDQGEEVPSDFRYLASTLRVSDMETGGTAILLLNPEVTTPVGEWEGWFHAHWVPGARVYPSFWELMQEEHNIFRVVEGHQR